MNTTVPIPAFLNGDFGALLTNTKVGTDALGRDIFAGQIFDPKTLRRVGGRWVADPFLGNMIPANRPSKVSANVIDIYRKSYQPMMPGFLTNNSALPLYNDPWFHQTQLTFKGDHSSSASSKLSGSLIWTQRPRILVDQGGVLGPSARRQNGWTLFQGQKPGSRQSRGPPQSQLDTWAQFDQHRVLHLPTSLCCAEPMGFSTTPLELTTGVACPTGLLRVSEGTTRFVPLETLHGSIGIVAIPTTTSPRRWIPTT